MTSDLTRLPGTGCLHSTRSAFSTPKETRLDEQQDFDRGACVALAGFLCIVAAGAADAQTNAPPAAQEIVRAGTQPSQQGPADFFTGRVRVDPVWAANADINASGGLVTFEPGARSAWHTHPTGTAPRGDLGRRD